MKGLRIARIIRTVVFLAVAFAAWKIVPVYAAALRFRFALSEACKTAATARLPVQEIRNDILFKARQLALPIRPENVEVQVRQQAVRALVAYQVPVDLGPREITLKFHATAEELPLVFIHEGDGPSQ